MIRHLDGRAILSVVAVASVLLWAGCAKKTEGYSMDDFTKVKKIDAHVHDNTVDPAFEIVAQQDGFRLLSINVDYPDFPSSDTQLNVAVQKVKEYPALFAFASTFHMTGFDDPGWSAHTNRYLDSTFAAGAIAVKFWKNIGMVFRDKNGALVMINDPRLQPIFDHLAERKIPVVNHTGEPRDCWLPVEKMMSNDMKEYFSHHPQYHMYLHPDMPSYEAQIRARDSMLSRNPTVTVMGAHLGSLEWSVDSIESMLAKHPNAVVDIAARMDYLQIQSQQNWEKVRQFFCNYPDRILYGTDLVRNPSDSAAAFTQAAHEKWLSDWEYLVTDSTLTLANVTGPVKGLALPRDVIDKVYCLNAERVFPRAWKVQ